MSVTMGGDDPESLDFERLNDLYVVDNLAIDEMEKMPDIFSPDAPPVDDSPEATAAFDSFVNELDGTMATPMTQGPQQLDGIVDTTGGGSDGVTDAEHLLGTNRAVPTTAGPQSSSTSYSSALSTQLPMTAEDYPDRLDLRALGAHSLPLNIAADVSLQADAARSSTLYSNGVNLLLQDSDALSAHLALPSRPWSIGIASRTTRAQKHDTVIPISHTTAASRGRPRVREMMHLPERSASFRGIGGNASTPAATAKLRYSKGAAPSKYCHVCGRSAKTVSVALCGNNQLGLCRKVVCDKCLLMHQRDSWELAKRGGAGWICMHCRNLCPERARCHQYQRNNLKRRMRAAAPPTPNASNGTANIRRAATGRVMKGVRAAGTATGALRTATMSDVASVALCATNASTDGMTRGGFQISDSGLDFRMSEDEAKVPQMLTTITAEANLNAIIPAELDERSNQIRSSNSNANSNANTNSNVNTNSNDSAQKVSQLSNQVMLHFNADKGDTRSDSFHTVPVEPIGSNVIDDNENIFKVESTFKQEQQISETPKLIQNSNEYTSSNIFLGSEVVGGIGKKEENLVTKEELIENDKNEHDGKADVQIQVEDSEKKLNS